MEIYHGGLEPISEPRLPPAVRRLDFGAGFYTTSDHGQAERWASIKRRRIGAGRAVVSIYDASQAFEAGALKIKIFPKASDEWLDFVMANRMGNCPHHGIFDIVRGPVANDTLYETLTLYDRGILNRGEAIARLRTHKLADQIVFATIRALGMLSYLGCEEVE